MKKQLINPENAAFLRQRAEEHLRLDKSKSKETATEADVRKLIHELEVHQIELEMQNEELVAAKERAELAEAKYKELYDFAPSGYLSITKDGEITELNFVAARMLGKERAKLMMDKFAFYLSLETRPVFCHLIQNIFKSKKTQSCEVVIAFEDVPPLYVNISAISSVNNDLCLLTLLDITERKLAEIELKKARENTEDSERLLSKAQEISHTGSWKLDLISNKLTWSDEVYRIFGCEPQEFTATYEAFLEFVHPEDRIALNDAYLRSLQDGSDSYEIEHRIVRRNTGEIRYVYERCIHEHDNKCVIIQSTGMVQDITESKRAESEKELLINQLNQAQKMELLGQLAGGVAHDFNNLLTLIMGYSAELNSNPILDSAAKEDAEEIFKASTRAKRLTQQLLTFSRKQVVQAVVLDLNELIANLQSVFNRLIGAHIKVIFQASTAKAMVKIDRIQMEQAVINLVLNSRDAMPSGGTVKIMTSVIERSSSVIEDLYKIKPGKYILLSVTDNGCGIPKELHNKMFEPFFTTKDKGKGLGLGLPNVSNIIKSSGGGITFESTPGTGTTFTILMPYTSELPKSEDLDLIDNDLNGNGETILIVEDEEALSIYFQNKLSKIGYNVTVVNSGAEALVLLENRYHPDLVITDIIMPEMNGKELVDLILLQNPEQKILFMSGFTDDIIQPLGVTGTNIPFIQKPFTASELAIVIRNLLSSPKQHQAKSNIIEKDAAKAKVKILMLDDDADFLILVQRVCNKMGHEFFGVHNLTGALSELDRAPYDVLLIDDNLGSMTGPEALMEIRAKGHSIPAIGISGVLNAEHVKVMKEAGMINVLEKSCDFKSLINAALLAAKHSLPH